MSNKTHGLMVTIYPANKPPRDIKSFPKTRTAEAIKWAKSLRPSAVWNRKTGEVIHAWPAIDEFDEYHEKGVPQ